MAFNGDTKMGELFDNPQTMEVLMKYLPEIKTAGPMLKMARNMTLNAVAGFPQAKISPEKVAGDRDGAPTALERSKSR